MPTFVLNDETKVNTYGFRIPNAGGNFSRFDVNPVMLDSHQNTLKTVLGAWENRRIEGYQLKADTDFDSEDPTVVPIEDKVERGYIKGCSMGILFDCQFMERAPDGVWELKQWELMEVSLCGVPSNAGSICLYNTDGELIPEGEVKLSLQKLTNEQINLNHNTNPNMAKINLTPGALVAMGLNNAEDDAAVSASIEKLAADNATLKNTNKLLDEQVKKQAKLQAEALVNPAILTGKLTADQKDQFIELATTNYEMASTIIGSMKGKASLGATVDNPAGAGADDPKTMDDFMKLPLEKQLAFKAANPEGYHKLFNA